MPMKSWIFIGIACALTAPWLRAQTLSDDSEQKARDLLRSVVEQRERQLNPAKQAPAPIYTSSNSTQIAPAKTAPMTPAPVVTAPSTPAPAVAARTTPAPAVTAPTLTAPAVAAPSTPAPAVGAPDASTEDSLGPTGYQTFPRPPTYPEVERDYLAGKITAKQFQRYLRDHTLDPVSPASKSPNALARTYESTRSNPNPPLNTPAREPAVSPSNPPAEVQPQRTETAGDSGNLNDLEKKMDELLRLKTAREQASMNAAATNAVAAAPKTKRERLDALLRLYLTGKISEPEYNEQRAKLISETGK